MNTLRILASAALALTTLELAEAGELGLKEPQVTTAIGAQKQAAPKAVAPVVVGRVLPIVGQAAPLPPTAYTFTLNSFKITNTRSLHLDTDYVSISVAVGANKPITLPPVSMGNINNGTYQVQLSIPDVSVAANQAVAFSYSIVNSGFNQNSLEHALNTFLTQAAEKAVTAGTAALGTALGGPAGGSLGSVVGQESGSWAVAKLANIIFADCDGSVAGGQHVFSGAQLAAQTAARGVISATDSNPGTNSPTGCGSNSQYFVTWSINNSASPPPPPGHGGGGGGPPGRHELE